MTDLARIAICNPFGPYAAWVDEFFAPLGYLMTQIGHPSEGEEFDVVILCGDATGAKVKAPCVFTFGRPTGDHRAQGLGQWVSESDTCAMFATFPVAGQADALAHNEHGEALAWKNGVGAHFSVDLGRMMRAFALGYAVHHEPDGLGEPCTPSIEWASRSADPSIDILRLFVHQQMVSAVEQLGKTMLRVLPWPGGARLGAVVSVDGLTDNPSDLYTMQKALTLNRTKATYFCPEGVFGADLYRYFRSIGQEIGLLAEIEPGHAWNADKLKVERRKLERLAGMQCRMVRPAEGRWFGLDEPYIAAHEASFSGVSARGPVGPEFGPTQFGTTFPLKVHGVYEIPYGVRDAGQISPISQVDSYIAERSRLGGLVQFSLRVSMVENPVALAELRRGLALVRGSGGQIMTLSQVTEFETARRSIRPVSRKRSDRFMVAHQVRGLTLSALGSHENGRVTPRDGKLWSDFEFDVAANAPFGPRWADLEAA